MILNLSDDLVRDVQDALNAASTMAVDRGHTDQISKLRSAQERFAAVVQSSNRPQVHPAKEREEKKEEKAAAPAAGRPAAGTPPASKQRK